MAWNPEEAQYILNELVGRRKIRLADLRRILNDRQKEIRRLRERIAELEGLGGSARGTRRAMPKRRREKRPSPRRRKLKLSPRERAQRRLQGKYMGFVRRLTAAQKAEVRKVRQERGWRGAIATARKMAKA